MIAIWFSVGELCGERVVGCSVRQGEGRGEVCDEV